MITIEPYDMPARVNSYQTDSRCRLSLPSLFQLFQEIAYRHAEDLNWGWEVLHSRNQFWALTRVVMEIDRMPLWNEELTIRTAPRKGEGVMAPRDLLVIDSEGKICVRCTSFWIIMDISERKPVMPDRFFEGFNFSEACDLCCLPFRKIRGDFEGEPVYSRNVHYSSLDMNNHVNNSAYVRFLVDGLEKEELEEKRITQFQIVFQQEAGNGDRLDIYRGQDKNGAILLKAGEGENSVVSSRIVLEPLS